MNEIAQPSEDLSSLGADLKRVSISSVSRWGDCKEEITHVTRQSAGGPWLSPTEDEKP